MLRDKILTEAQMKLKEPIEGVSYDDVQYGTCRFCNQIGSFITKNGAWTQEDCDECATEICGCPHSTCYATRKERIETAAIIIDQKFGKPSPQDDYLEEDCEDVCAFLNHVAVEVSKGTVGKTSVVINDKIKCSIGITAKGKIRIERTITRKDGGEA